MNIRKDVVIIGAGAAGLFCAIQAGKRGRSVTVLEHSGRAGKKILAGGGGNCNFTNLHMDPGSFICRNPHFHKSALARFTPDDFLALIRKHKIPYVEKKAGQLFCTVGAQAILQMLLVECSAAGVEIRTRYKTGKIQKNGTFRIETDRETYESESLVIATGGLSYPKLGASDFGYQIARQFRLNIIPLKPALVPLLLADKERQAFRSLSGISLDCIVRLHQREFRESLLFTHKGLSGPAILQASSYWHPGEFLQIDLVPGRNILELLAAGQERGKGLKTVLSRVWPRRFAQAWIDLYCGEQPLEQISKRQLAAIAGLVHHWKLRPTGTEGFAKAEATSGGIDSAELSSQTMEALKVPSLYFIGEIVDVTGQLGGFNLQWAWSSGYAAGIHC
jgi:predicted Rossmann fold flavoprotein